MKSGCEQKNIDLPACDSPTIPCWHQNLKKSPIISVNESITEAASPFVDLYIKTFVSELPSFIQHSSHAFNPMKGFRNMRMCADHGCGITLEQSVITGRGSTLHHFTWRRGNVIWHIAATAELLLTCGGGGALHYLHTLVGLYSLIKNFSCDKTSTVLDRVWRQFQVRVNFIVPLEKFILGVVLHYCFTGQSHKND